MKRHLVRRRVRHSSCAKRSASSLIEQKQSAGHMVQRSTKILSIIIIFNNMFRSDKTVMRTILRAFGLSTTIVIASLTVFMFAEPGVGYSATTATSQFTISQSVTAEVAFKTPATNVSLAPAIGGLTGGDATGTTQVVVVTNDRLGYQMTIQASSSSGAMLGNSNPANTIPGYSPAVAGIPDYNFTVPANSAEFGYTVLASSSADVTAFFKNNGSACNTGSTNDAGHCWLNATNTPFTIVSTSGPTTPSGSTTTLVFHVKIQANPSPTIPDDTYVATTTLTAMTK